MRGLLQIQQPIVIGLAVGFLLHTTPAVADTAISKGVYRSSLKMVSLRRSWADASILMRFIL